MPTGVDTTYFAPASAPATPDAAGAPRLHRLDGLAAERRRACCISAATILPRIREAEPDVTLSIVGRAPTPAVKRLADEAGIEVTGRVDDVRPHIAAGAVYVVPLRIGGGTRLKIFEAMAMGKAVVSTTIGAEGLPVTPGRDVLIADDPRAFAQAVVAPDARRRGAPPHRDRGAARSSSSATTGRPWPRISSTR